MLLPFLPPTLGLGGTQESLLYPPHSWERDKEGKGKQYKEVVKSLAWVQILTPPLIHSMLKSHISQSLEMET